ncbi:MAG: hypothetical protein WBD20_06115 [Pirellulaceae bacterium]
MKIIVAILASSIVFVSTARGQDEGTDLDNRRQMAEERLAKIEEKRLESEAWRREQLKKHKEIYNSAADTILQAKKIKENESSLEKSSTLNQAISIIVRLKDKTLRDALLTQFSENWQFNKRIKQKIREAESLDEWQSVEEATNAAFSKADQEIAHLAHPTRQQHQKFVEELGEDHPAVKRSEEAARRLEQGITKNSIDSALVQYHLTRRIKSVDLVNQLFDRIVELEAEVESLRAAQAPKVSD